MTPLERQIAKGQSDELVFVASPDEVTTIISHVVALLNSGGGTVVLGVDSKGKPLEMSVSQERTSLLGEEIRKAISPKALVSVNAEKVKNKEIIAIDAPGGRNTPFVADGRVFLRQGGRNDTRNGQGSAAALSSKGLRTYPVGTSDLAGAGNGRPRSPGNFPDCADCIGGASVHFQEPVKTQHRSRGIRNAHRGPDHERWRYLFW